MLIFCLIVQVVLFAENINVYNLFSMKIPDDYYIYSIQNNLLYTQDSQQYWLDIDINCIYKNIYFTFNISFFGNQTRENAMKKFGFTQINQNYYNKYNSAMNNNILLQNNIKVVNKNYNFTEFIADWATGWSSDVIAYSFNPNIDGIEVCIISTINSWYALGAKQALNIPENNFSTKLRNENQDIQQFYFLYQNIIQSISPLQTNGKIITSGYSFETENYSEIVTPIIDNLRLRDGDTKTSNIIGYVEKRPYSILQKGKNEVIDGVSGTWIRIKPFLQNRIGWAFSGYMREMSNDEVSSYEE